MNNEHRIVTVEGVRIAYLKINPETSASDIPIIFLHDSLGCISVWKDFPGAVSTSKKLNAVVYDRQGYGRSDPFSGKMRDAGYLEEQADFLILFLNALNINECFLFGHSDGGSIALITAAKYPGKVKAVITEGAHVFVEEITLQGIRNAKALYQSTDLKSRLVKHHQEKTDALFNAWTETWLDIKFRDWNIEHFLELIKCPVLTIYGEDDEYGTLDQLASISTKVAGPAENLIIPACGHTPHKEARKETINETVQFLKGLI